MFFRDVFDKFPKFKKNKIWKQQNKKKQQLENKMQSNNKSKLMIVS